MPVRLIDLDGEVVFDYNKNEFQEKKCGNFFLSFLELSAHSNQMAERNQTELKWLHWKNLINHGLGQIGTSEKKNRSIKTKFN